MLVRATCYLSPVSFLAWPHHAWPSWEPSAVLSAVGSYIMRLGLVKMFLPLVPMMFQLFPRWHVSQSLEGPAVAAGCGHCQPLQATASTSVQQNESSKGQHLSLYKASTRPAHSDRGVAGLHFDWQHVQSAGLLCLASLPPSLLWWQCGFKGVENSTVHSLG